MSKIFKFGVLVATTLLAILTVGCTNDPASEKDPDTTPTAVLTLTPSAEEVLAAKGSFVTFTAEMDGVDVTSDETLEVYRVDNAGNLEFLSNLKYEATRVGTYKFYAICSDANDNSIKSETISVEAVTADISLSASCNEIIVGVTENNSVEFSVLLKGEEVSIDDENLELFVSEKGSEEQTKLTSLDYAIEDDKTYTFIASYNFLGTTIYTEEVEVTGVVRLNIVPSFYTLNLDESASSTVNLDVKFGNEVIAIDTPNMELYYMEGDTMTTLDTPSYEINEAKTYKFYVEYTPEGGEMITTEVSVIGANLNSIKFKKRVLGLVFTGTWCGYCPGVTAGLIHFEKNYGDDKLVVVTAHNGNDIMANTYASTLTLQMGVSGFPTTFIGSINDNAYKMVGAGDTYQETMEAINKSVNNITAQGIGTAISCSSVYDEESLYINATVAVNKESHYKIGAMLVEDGIYSKQTCYGDVSDLNLGDHSLDIHNNVLQAIFPASLFPAVDLANMQQHLSNNVYSFDCEIDLTKLYKLKKIENCRIVVYTYNEKTGYVDNVIQAPIGTKREFDAN